MSKRKSKSVATGRRTNKYRGEVEGRLAAMGFSPSRYRWLTAPSRLIVIVDDMMREFPLHASQSRARTEYELGRLDTWAEVLNLKPRMTVTPLPAQPKRKARAVDPAQLDPVEMVAALPKPNGAIHVAGG